MKEKVSQEKSPDSDRDLLIWAAPIIIHAILVVIYSVFMCMNDAGLTLAGKIVSILVFLVLAFVIEGILFCAAGIIEISSAFFTFLFLWGLISILFPIFLPDGHLMSGYLYRGLLFQMARMCYILGDDSMKGWGPQKEKTSGQ